MDPERWRLVETLFHRAVDVEPDTRGAFLERECGGDVELRAHVEKLLAADTQANTLVDRLERGELHPIEDHMIGRDIGPFRLLERVAVGGMGVVYRAERIDGLFQQEVAVKLIRAELASEPMIRRFEFERRTLAALHHQNIAPLHDGGTTPEGRPYLVMEFVRGTPIDRYCDEHRSSIEERLQLFVAVCRAVHFAHQNVVVHRDLKPGNILVDESGAPKLLDFGIARLLDDLQSEPGHVLTRTGAQILTPEYASPEQILGGPVTTGIDVYSLGIVLYELLTGHKPYRSDNRSLIEWQRDVLERAPTRPSTKVMLPELPAPGGAQAELSAEELAARRGYEPRGLRRRLRGDLDRIVLMALRKEPARRYASVKDMADDIERHFSGHPVSARADSVSYRVQKFVQRNRIAVASGLLVLAALVFGIVAARRGEVHAQEQAEHARFEAESFEGIADFLMTTFLSSQPLDDAGVELKRHRIQMHAARLRRQYADQDHLRANLLDSLGRVALRLGLSTDAEGLIDEAVAIRVKAFGADSLEYALSLRSVGLLHYGRGELSAAVEAFEKALLLHRTRPKETHTDVAAVANDLAACLRGLGRLDEAAALHEEALALRRAAGDGSLDVAESQNNFAGVYLDRSDFGRAAERLEEALAIRRRILGPEDPLTVQSMSNLAMTVWRLDRREEAHALLAEVETSYRALHADGEEGLAQALSNRGGMLIVEKRLVEAEAPIAEALALQTKRLGPTNPAVASILTRQAQLQVALGRKADARTSWERVVALRRDASQSPRYLGQALCDYGVFLLETKALAESRAALAEAVELLRKTGSQNTPLLARAEAAFGEVLLDQGEVAEAREHLIAALSILEALPAGNAPELERVKKNIARCEPSPAQR